MLEINGDEYFTATVVTVVSELFCFVIRSTIYVLGGSVKSLPVNWVSVEYEADLWRQLIPSP